MGELAVAVTAIAVVLIERIFSARESEKQREFEQRRANIGRRRGLYVAWLKLTGGIGPLILDYITAQTSGGSLLKTEWNRSLQEIEQAIALDAPSEVVQLLTAHRVAIGNAAPEAFKEAGSAAVEPGKEFSLTFALAIQRMTVTERLALLNAMRADLGNDTEVRSLG